MPLNLLHETMGSEDFTKALNYAEGIWDTDGAKKAFDIVTKLARASLFYSYLKE